MSEHERTSLLRLPLAGLLTWLVPGLGHMYLGHKGRGLICLVAITITFWTGVAIGGVRATVDPHERKLWFLAQLCTAGNTLVGYGLRETIASPGPMIDGDAIPAPWASADVALHYTGVAGLLNLLVVFDALARAEPRPTRRRERRSGSGGDP